MSPDNTTPKPGWSAELRNIFFPDPKPEAPAPVRTLPTPLHDHLLPEMDGTYVPELHPLSPWADDYARSQQPSPLFGDDGFSNSWFGKHED